MKYSIVALLAFCAITAYATPVPGDNLNAIRNTIEGIAAKGQEVYNKLFEKLFNQKKCVDEQLNLLANNADAKVKEVFRKAIVKYNELKEQDLPGGYCIGKYSPKYKNVTTETQKDYEKCVNEITANKQNLIAEVENQLNEIKKKIDEISQKRQNELSVEFEDIKILSYDVFESGVNGGVELVKFAKQCEASAYNKFHKNFTDVVNSFVDCVQNPVEKKTEKPVEAETEKSAE